VIGRRASKGHVNLSSPLPPFPSRPVGHGREQVLSVRESLLHKIYTGLSASLGAHLLPDWYAAPAPTIDRSTGRPIKRSMFDHRTSGTDGGECGLLII
jgi:hypothetical protein